MDAHAREDKRVYTLRDKSKIPFLCCIGTSALTSADDEQFELVEATGDWTRREGKFSFVFIHVVDHMIIVSCFWLSVSLSLNPLCVVHIMLILANMVLCFVIDFFP